MPSTSPHPLPTELLLQIFEHLLATPSGVYPIAFTPSDIRTRTLHSLLFVSKSLSKIASRYLHTHCLHLSTPFQVSQIHARLTCPSPSPPASNAKPLPHITSVHLLHLRSNYFLDIHLESAMDFLALVAPTLKRLAIFLPFQSVSENRRLKLTGGVLSRLPVLEELVTKTSCLLLAPPAPLPALRRLALSCAIGEVELAFLAACPALEVLVARRKWHADFEVMIGRDIDNMFAAYVGQEVLRVLWVAKAARHGPPGGRREWHVDDRVRFFEADVPVSYYGDEGGGLCQEYIKEGGVRGTIWGELEGARAMESAASARKRGA